MKRTNKQKKKNYIWELYDCWQKQLSKAWLIKTNEVVVLVKYTQMWIYGS